MLKSGWEKDRSPLAKYSNKKVHIFLTPGQLLITIAAGLVCVFIESAFITNLHRERLENQIDEATRYGQSVATSLILSLDQAISTSTVLKDLYVEYGDTYIKTFNKTCRRFYDDNPSIGSLYIAPNGIVAAAFPEKIKASTIGFNMLEDEQQKQRAQLAIDTKKITVAGPLNLIEGGTGIIIRNPYFENDEFKFFAVVAIDWEQYVYQALRGLNHKKSGYHIAVWKDDNTNTVTDKFGCIISDLNKEITDKDIIDIEIRIPNDKWHLTVEPEKGWITMADFIPIMILCSIIVILVMGLLVFRQLESNKKLYEYEHDVLTGLLTRSAFYRRVRKMFREYPNENFDIMVSDIENFKLLNSVYGTKKCDELLCYFASEFQKINLNSTFARYGGDHYVNIFKSSENIGSEAFLEKVKVIIENAPIPNTVVKFGYYGKVDKSITPNLLCDRALLAAKSILHNYENTIANYEGPISHRHLQEQMLEASFEDAIKNGDFKVWFQPKFDAKTEKLVGAEALVRWINKAGKVVSPADFIYVFEDDGLIVRLDEFVFRNVCQTIKTYTDNGYPPIPVSVNLSRASLHHSGVIQHYKDIVEEIGIPIDAISLEITETSAFKNNQIQNLAIELKNAGFRIDMDDFGTGSSSLASLNLIPFDVIKLDKSLVDFIGTPDGEELLKHSIELAHFKNIHVIAEGVEHKEQLEFLRKLNCDTIQGYYYSPPLPIEECINYIDKLNKDGRV